MIVLKERNRDKCFEDNNRICRKKILYLRYVQKKEITLYA